MGFVNFIFSILTLVYQDTMQLLMQSFVFNQSFLKTFISHNLIVKIKIYTHTIDKFNAWLRRRSLKL